MVRNMWKKMTRASYSEYRAQLYGVSSPGSAEKASKCQNDEAEGNMTRQGRTSTTRTYLLLVP